MKEEEDEEEDSFWTTEDVVVDECCCFFGCCWLSQKFLGGFGLDAGIGDGDVLDLDVVEDCRRDPQDFSCFANSSPT